ncbi:MAG: hypothetical protein LBT05_00490 [Planctomycetaceae bacterium]|jgi:hypothetical protein|nr:hypothetical protein [Planctomycetaceae bacterium]
MKNTYFISLILLLILSVGCSKNVKITGHVTFADNGEPVNFGAVCFETAENTFYGTLDQNGFYAVGDTHDGAGIPPGNYQVWLSGTVLTEDIPSKGNDGLFNTKETVRVHPKYTLPNPDGLKFEVKRNGAKTFDFTAERPPKK